MNPYITNLACDKCFSPMSTGFDKNLKITIECLNLSCDELGIKYLAPRIPVKKLQEEQEDE